MDLGPLLKLIDESPFVPSLMNIDNLAFLVSILIDPPQQFVEDGKFKEIESLARSIASSIKTSKIETFMSLRLASLPIWRWMSPAKTIYDQRPKPSRIHYPRTGQLSFLRHLSANVYDLAGAGKASYSIGPLKHFVLRLNQMLQLLSYHFMEFPERRKEEADLKDMVQSVTNLAYEAEYVFDSFLVRDIPIWCCVFWLRDILEELGGYERQIKMVFGDMDSILKSILKPESDLPGLRIIPIVNNLGIRKKIMQVFDDRKTKFKFKVRAWSVVSFYKEKGKEVFLQLLCNASHPYTKRVVRKEELERYPQAKLARKLYKLVNPDSFLIFLEDVSDIDILNDIIGVLPNSRRGTILLTTPSPEFAVRCRYGYQEVISSNMSGHHSSMLQTNKATIENDVVGFEAEAKRMLELLIGEPKRVRIISIVGMAGQGKTTFAKKLYSDVLVINFFDICAWCCVSQAYEKRKVLLEVLGEVGLYSDAMHNKNDEELAEMLYKHLKGRRYLVILDDIWNIDSWNNLERCFPNDNNGSRIIFTSRIKELASQVKYDSIVQSLHPLSDDESFELLEKKVFKMKSCPLELVELGTQIAKRCKGLPLLVVLVAGLLSRMGKEKEGWNRIAESLNSYVLGDPEAHGKYVIELSYKQLPDHLKPCFLYFGAFLESKEVSATKLTRLWIAEGFVEQTELKSLEGVAKDYLRDLIGRSLVTVAQEKSGGGVKSCCVHDLLREFCLIRAMEDNFLQQIHEHGRFFPSSNGSQDYNVDLNCSSSSSPIRYHLRRLCIYVQNDNFLMFKPLGPLVRSLLFFAGSDVCKSFSSNISFISHNFKLLRILDLEGFNIGNSLEEIGVLVQLRYLAVEGRVDCIPSSIANLLNLETLLVKGLEATVVKVPDSLWDMAKLRHMHVNAKASFDLNSHRSENSTILDNLQTFSTPILAYGDDMEKVIRRMQSIQKLKCIFLDSWSDAKMCNQFPLLGCLSNLVSLKTFYNGVGKYPCEFDFPSNLKKLTLSNFKMPSSEISQLAMLCNLEVLKLLNNAFEGEKWEMGDEVFTKLKYLKLDTLSIVQWNATEYHFPRLEHLLLHKCEQLEEIPQDIGDIPTLLMIEVMWCTASAGVSAMKIQENQMEFGNDGLEIHVHPKVWM